MRRTSRRRSPSPFQRDTKPQNMQDQENTLSTIRRSSVSRRLDPLLTDSYKQRSRSAERNIPEPDADGEGHVVIEEEEKEQQQHSPREKLTRIDSDPLDSPGGVVKRLSKLQFSPTKGIIDGGVVVGSNRRKPALPTLPRYPIAETKNHNCWSEPHAGKCFKVRGPNYLGDKKKVASGPYIFPARGADLILTNEESGKGTDIAERHCVLGGHVRSVPTFIINFCFPWGNLVNYYEIPELYASFLQKKQRGDTIHDEMLEMFAPHERNVIRFLIGDDAQRQDKLKLIPVCIEGPWVVRQMISGKPAVIGKRLPVNYRYHPADPSRGLEMCFEADLDISASDPVGKKVVKLCTTYLTSVTVDIGVVIEGIEEDELPEQMLGCVRIHKLDSLLSPTLPAD